MSIKKLDVAGLSTVSLTRKEFAELFLEENRKFCIGDKAKTVFSSNGQGIALTVTLDGFKETMLKADYIHADGMSVVYASRLKNKSALPERIATTDLIHDISKLATSSHKLNFFLFGASASAVSGAAKNLVKLYPNINVIGFQNGYDYDIKEVIERINELKPDIVWVAFGKPKQEEISLILQKELIGTTWIKTCGGLLDFLCGDSKRAPEWMQRYGLEWFHRMLMRPNKLFVRYLTTNLIAIYAFLRF